LLLVGFEALLAWLLGWGMMDALGLCDVRTLVVACFDAQAAAVRPSTPGRAELPESLKALFRPITVVVPDRQLIMENMLMAEVGGLGWDGCGGRHLALCGHSPLDRLCSPCTALLQPLLHSRSPHPNCLLFALHAARAPPPKHAPW
jgi:hypothetical protein